MEGSAEEPTRTCRTRYHHLLPPHYRFYWEITSPHPSLLLALLGAVQYRHSFRMVTLEAAQYNSILVLVLLGAAQCNHNHLQFIL